MSEIFSYYVITEKLCATCEYWLSDKVYSGNMVYTFNDEGQCINKDFFSGMSTLQMCNCKGWKQGDSNKLKEMQ